VSFALYFVYMSNATRAQPPIGHLCPGPGSSAAVRACEQVPEARQSTGRPEIFMADSEGSS
jgi:hypothetical protein